MSTDDSDSLDRVVVGRIGRPHGIHGDVFVQPLTDAPELRFAEGAALLAGHPVSRTLKVVRAKDHSGKFVVSFAGVTDRTAAEGLRGTLLEAYVDPLLLPDDDDEYFDRQLIGLRGIDPTGVELGVVTDVIHLPAQDVLAVLLVDGSERLVPFVRQIVPTVDLAAGLLIIDAPSGLLEDEPETDDPEVRDAH